MPHTEHEKIYTDQQTHLVTTHNYFVVSTVRLFMIHKIIHGLLYVICIYIRTKQKLITDYWQIDINY